MCLIEAYIYLILFTLLNACNIIIQSAYMLFTFHYYKKMGLFH